MNGASISRIGFSLALLALISGLACHRASSPTLDARVEELSAQDLADVFTPSRSTGWGAYHSDGTPRGDSTVRIAWVGMWDVEGGDWDRGLRLIRAAYARGVPDRDFYHDYIAAMRLARRPADVKAACDALVKLWPADSADVRICEAELRPS